MKKKSGKKSRNHGWIWGRGMGRMDTDVERGGVGGVACVVRNPCTSVIFVVTPGCVVGIYGGKPRMMAGKGRERWARICV